jgi:hypothetical protein
MCRTKSFSNIIRRGISKVSCLHHASLGNSRVKEDIAESQLLCPIEILFKVRKAADKPVGFCVAMNLSIPFHGTLLCV